MQTGSNRILECDRSGEQGSELFGRGSDSSAIRTITNASFVTFGLAAS